MKGSSTIIVVIASKEEAKEEVKQFLLFITIKFHETP